MLKKITFLFTILLLLFSTASIASAASVGRPVIRSINTRTADSQTITWSRVKGATGYIVSCRTSGTSYRKVATISGGSTTSAVIYDRLPNVSYRYTVKAKKGGSYGTWSVTKTASLNKQKAIYGKNVSYSTYGRYYSSRSAAERNMTTIRVKTWDFVKGKSGRKYTRYWNIKVNKKVSRTVRKMFQELYNSPDRFPIHELGGWRWDGGRSEHNDGTAIDINYTENYMIRSNGQIVAGRYWRPGKDPYSIPKNGTLARIFKKYGFSQGIWSSSQDYMHFSYFGT